MTTVKEAWDSFAAMVLTPAHPEVQYTEMRRAFYAGAWGMLMGCSGIGDDSASEDAGVERLEAWRKELETFQRDMRAGRA
jgi:hypothetical protein